MSIATCLGLTALTISLNASTLTTNPIPVTGSGEIFTSAGITTITISFTGSNSEGDFVGVNTANTFCSVTLVSPVGQCFMLGSGTSLGVDGFFYDSAQLARTSTGAEISFSGPLESTSPTTAIAPLAWVLTFGQSTESCSNGGTPPFCGGPPSGCGSDPNDFCTVTTPFVITPVPEPSTALLLLTGVLCVLGLCRIRLASSTCHRTKEVLSLPPVICPASTVQSRQSSL